MPLTSHLGDAIVTYNNN